MKKHTNLVRAAVLLAAGGVLPLGTQRAEAQENSAPTSISEPVSANESAYRPTLIVAPMAETVDGEGRPVVTGILTLPDAIQAALKNSPVLRGATAELDAAIAQLGAAKSALKPSLSATTFLTTGSENGPIYGSPDAVTPQNLFAVPHGPFTDQNIMLMLPLLTGGRLQALRRAAEANSRASKYDLDTMRLDVTLETKTAYRTVLLVLETQKVAQARQDATAKNLANDRAAETAGRVPQLYVMRDEAEDADAQQGVTNAARDVELAYLTLRAVMGVSGDSQFTLSGSLEPVPEGEVTGSDIGGDLAAARRLRPEILGARQRLESAQRGSVAAMGASKFQASLVGMADVNQSRGNGSGGLSVGVVVGVPLFDGGLRRAGRDEANAAVAKAQAELDRVDIQIDREIRSARITLSAAQQNVATAQNALTASEEGYRVATLRYEGGRATNAEVLDSLAALTRARGNRMKALFEAQTALDQKTRALGK